MSESVSFNTALMPGEKVYSKTFFGKKQESVIVFPGEYDFIIYYTEATKHQRFYRVTNPKSKVLIFGIPGDGYKFINEDMFNFIAGSGFNLLADMCERTKDAYILDHSKFVYGLFSRDNIISVVSDEPIATSSSSSTETMIKYNHVFYGRKEESSVDFAKDYDFIIYYVSDRGDIIENQHFYLITAPNGKVLIFGIPADGCIFIDGKLLCKLQSWGFHIDPDVFKRVVNTYIDDHSKFVYRLFCVDIAIEYIGAGKPPVNTPNAITLTKPVWKIIPADKWTEVPVAAALKIIPCGGTIQIRIDEDLYKEIEDGHLYAMATIQNKPYATININPLAKSIFLYSDKPIHYKAADKTEYNFCTRLCETKDLSFYAAGAVKIYCGVKGRLDYNGKTTFGKKNEAVNMYEFDIEADAQGPRQTEYKMVNMSQSSDEWVDFIILYKL